MIKRCIPALVLSSLLLSCNSYYITTHSPIQEAVDKKIGLEVDFHSTKALVLGEGITAESSVGWSLFGNPAGLSTAKRWTIWGGLNLHYTSERVDNGDGVYPQANFFDLSRSCFALNSPTFNQLGIAVGSSLAYDLSYDLDPQGDQQVKYSGGIRAYSIGFGWGFLRGFSGGLAFDYLRGSQRVDINTISEQRSEDYSFDGYRLHLGLLYSTSLPFKDLGISWGFSLIPHGVVNRSGGFEEEIGLPLHWQTGFALTHPFAIIYMGLGQVRWTETASTESDIQLLYNRRYVDGLSYSVGVAFPNLIPEVVLYAGYQLRPFAVKTENGEKLSVKCFALGASGTPSDGKGLGWEIAGRYSTYGSLGVDLVEGNISEMVVGLSWGF